MKKYTPKKIIITKDNLRKIIQSLKPFTERCVKTNWTVDISLTTDKPDNEQWQASVKYHTEPAIAELAFYLTTWLGREYESLWLAKKAIFNTLIHEFTHVRMQDYIFMYKDGEEHHRKILHERIAYMADNIAEVCLSDKELFKYLRSNKL